MLGGYRNTMTMVITGLDVEAKAEHATRLLLDRLGGASAYEDVDIRLLRFDQPDAPSNELATAHLRVTVKDTDERKAGRAFSDAITEQALAGYAGFHTTTPPTGASAYGVYWPALIPAAAVIQQLHLPDGPPQVIPHTSGLPGLREVSGPVTPAPGGRPRTRLGWRSRHRAARPAVRRPVGRQGRQRQRGPVGPHPAGYAWLRQHLTTGRFRELLTESAALDVDRYELPNLLALNFVVHGLLAPGVSATTRPDAQAKGLGEYLRSRLVTVPASVAAQAPARSA